MSDKQILTGPREKWQLWKTEQSFELWAHVSDRGKLRNELIAEFREKPCRKEVVRKWLEELNFRLKMKGKYGNR